MDRHLSYHYYSTSPIALMGLSNNSHKLHAIMLINRALLFYAALSMPVTIVRPLDCGTDYSCLYEILHIFVMIIFFQLRTGTSITSLFFLFEHLFCRLTVRLRVQNIMLAHLPPDTSWYREINAADPNEPIFTWFAKKDAFYLAPTRSGIQQSQSKYFGYRWRTNMDLADFMAPKYGLNPAGAPNRLKMGLTATARDSLIITFHLQKVYRSKGID